jgi:DinB family protein
MTSTESITFEAFRDSLAGQLQWCIDRIVATFEATPEDKLDFKIAPTSMSVREMAQHVIHGNNLCLGMVGAEIPPVPDSQSKDEITTALRVSGEALADYASKSTEAVYQEKVMFFGHEISMTSFVMKCSWHIGRHAAQIDFLQTTWGDMEDH